MIYTMVGIGMIAELFLLIFLYIWKHDSLWTAMWTFILVAFMCAWIAAGVLLVDKGIRERRIQHESQRLTITE